MIPTELHELIEALPDMTRNLHVPRFLIFEALTGGPAPPYHLPKRINVWTIWHRAISKIIHH
jgi:hypothetical protein